MVYTNKYFSNTKKNNVFAKTLIEAGIVGHYGEKFAISNDVLEKNISKVKYSDIVLGHNKPSVDKGIVVGKVLDVYMNGSEGTIDRNGGIYDKTGWTAIYELDEKALMDNGLSIEEAGKLDLSLSLYPEYKHEKELYNGVMVDDVVSSFNINNVAIVPVGRYNATQNIINNSQQEGINLTFTNKTEEKNVLSNMDENKEILDNSAEENKPEEKAEEKQDNKPASTSSEDNQGEKSEEKKDNGENRPDTNNGDEKNGEKEKIFGENKPEEEQKSSQTFTMEQILEMFKAFAGGSALMKQATEGTMSDDILKTIIAPEQAQPQPQQPMPEQQQQMPTEQGGECVSGNCNEIEPQPEQNENKPLENNQAESKGGISDNNGNFSNIADSLLKKLKNLVSPENYNEIYELLLPYINVNNQEQSLAPKLDNSIEKEEIKEIIEDSKNEQKEIIDNKEKLFFIF